MCNQQSYVYIYFSYAQERGNVGCCGLFWEVFLQLRLEPTSSVVQKWMTLIKSCYRYNAPATPTAGPTNVVGTRTLVNALMGPPRRGIFFTAPFAMWTTKMPPIMNKPRRFPRSRATRFNVSLANLSKWWNVRSGWSEREESPRTAELMSSCVTGRNTSFPAFGSRSSVSLCTSRKWNVITELLVVGDGESKNTTTKLTYRMTSSRFSVNYKGVMRSLILTRSYIWVVFGKARN